MAKRNWDCELRGIKKNASFKSKVVNQLVSGGIVPSRIEGLGATECKGITASSIILKSCTRW